MTPMCPKCGSEDLIVERRLDGLAKCSDCGLTGSYLHCFARIPYDRPQKTVVVNDCVSKERFDKHFARLVQYGNALTRISENATSLIEAQKIADEALADARRNLGKPVVIER